MGDTYHKVRSDAGGRSSLVIQHGGQEIHRSQHDTREGAVHASKIHEQRHAQAAQEDNDQLTSMTLPGTAGSSEPTHHPDAAPGSPQAAELSAHDPDFGASERHLEHQQQTQQSGGNPYLERASEIFHRIQSDVKEPRRGTVKNILASMHALKTGGQPLNEANLKQHYKEATGSNLTKADLSHFEAATFHTPEEVMENKPLNAETERMKRGFAAKQFARLKPFLGAEFKSRHPDAPPPYPTYNDLKGWDEHARDGGGARPDWAGGTGRGGQKRAMPKEFHDSMPKVDGKPQMPPGWLPLHLAPVWSYVARSMAGKTDSTGRPSAYAAANLNEQDLRAHGLPTHDNQKVRMPSQSPTREETASGARKPEEMLLNSLRKYVQMRGGADQLVDIPESKVGKLEEGGVKLTHADLFKADEELSDQALQKIMTTKIIDPVGLMAVVKREMKGGDKKPVKKSIMLVVDHDAAFVPGERLAKSVKRDEGYEIDLAKAAKINRIQGILDGRAQSRA